MRTFLNDFISTLSYTGKQRAGFILETAKVEKSQLDVLAQKLSDQGIFSTIVLPDEKEGGTISPDKIRGSLHDVQVRIEEIYDSANLVSLVLASNIAILTADIKAAEDELTAHEKAIANYAFLLSDGGFYDYAFLESFSDTRNQDKFDYLVPDRGGLYFGQDEHAAVLTDEGAIALPQTVARTFPLRGQYIESNATAFITSMNSINASTSSSAGTGWRVAYATDGPVTSTLPSFTGLQEGFSSFPGVNLVIEYTLAAPAPCDTIRISPFSDGPFELVQLELFDDMEETHKENLIEAPIQIDSTRNIYFNLRPVSKMRLYLRQANYVRNGLQPIKSEDLFRKVVSGEPRDVFINTPLTEANDINRKSFLSSLVYDYASGGKRKGFRTLAVPKSLYAPMWGSGREALAYRRPSDHKSTDSRWSNDSVRNSFVERAIRSRLGLGEIFKTFLPYMEQQNVDGTAGNSTNSTTVGATTSTTGVAKSIHHTEIQQFKYEYNIGIQEITIGNSIDSYKGVFVSKPIPSTGDVGEVKIKVGEIHYLEAFSDKQQPRVTSVEYSVSNQSKPDSEADWLPILPTNNTTVTAERLLPDTLGKGLFRFPASLQDDIKLYKNGYDVTDIDVRNYLMKTNDRQKAIGVTLPLGYATSTDIFTIDYTPAGDYTIVNFTASGFADPPLVSSYDSDGAGEGFTNTNGQVIIDLKYEPFVDYNQVETSTYLASSGLSPYQPVLLRFDDGSVAFNLTNYKGGDQTTLNAAASDYQFIQNGRTLMFNKPINTSFRVYYQYLPNNLRFRTVLRCNSNEFVSPKVDFVQVKAKTRKSDAKRDT